MKAFAITRNALRRFFRDRTGLFFTAALPVIIILLIGTATSGFDDQVFPIGVTVADEGPLAADLRRALDRHERIDLVDYDDRLAMAKDVRRGAVPAGIVIPRSYDEALLAGETVDVELLVDQTRGSPGAVRSIVSQVIADRGAELQAAAFASERAGVPVTTTLTQARDAKKALQGVAVGVDAQTVGKAQRTYLAPGIGYQAPSNLVLFVFITSLAGSALLIQSRKLRVTQRMYATPTSVSSILFGEGMARFAIAFYQAVFIFLVGTVVFGVEWGNLVGAAILIVLFVLVGTSVGMLFGTIFSTPEQAGSIGAMAGIAMGMLGGCMWPLEIVPDTMRIAGHIFPHAWAMDAWIELIGRGGSVADIGRELAILAGYVAILLPLGTWRLKRALVS